MSAGLFWTWGIGAVLLTFALAVVWEMDSINGVSNDEADLWWLVPMVLLWPLSIAVIVAFNVVYWFLIMPAKLLAHMIVKPRKRFSADV